MGEFGYMQCKDVNQYGAFLDWGLMKQLFVPFREQLKRMEVGRHYVVYVYLDEETERLAASARINRFVDKKKILFSNEIIIYLYKICFNIINNLFYIVKKN